MLEEIMQAETIGTREHHNDVVIESTRAYATRTSILVGAIVATALMTAALADDWAARPDTAISVAGDSAQTVVPDAGAERSGSLAVHPLLY
jgi:hypothetical protein